MTPQEINIAIAEWRGWEFAEKESRRVGYQVFRSPDKKQISAILPDCYGDLNACHEAEMKLTASKHTDFCGELTRIAGSYGAYSATAPQRCESLLRTIGKWID